MTDSTANESDLWDEWQASERQQQSIGLPLDLDHEPADLEEAKEMLRRAKALTFTSLDGLHRAMEEAKRQQRAEPVAWADEHVETFVTQYNDVYCYQRRAGVGGGDAERAAMKQVLILAIGAYAAPPAVQDQKQIMCACGDVYPASAFVCDNCRASSTSSGSTNETLSS